MIAFEEQHTNCCCCWLTSPQLSPSCLLRHDLILQTKLIPAKHARMVAAPGDFSASCKTWNRQRLLPKGFDAHLKHVSPDLFTELRCSRRKHCTSLGFNLYADLGAVKSCHHYKYDDRICPTCRWDVPRGNILSTYLAACQRLMVSATSGVIESLSRRKCLMSPLPYHVFADFNKMDKIHYILSWSDFACTKQLPWKTFRDIIAVIAPLMTDEELFKYCQPASHLYLDECQHIIVRYTCLCNT